MQIVKNILIKLISQRVIILSGIIILGFNILSGRGVGWNVALKSSYFGAGPNIDYHKISVKNPMSFGFQVRYKVAPDFAFQYAIESINGKMEKAKGDELSIHNSLSALVFPLTATNISPYLISGVRWIQLNRSGENGSLSDLNIQLGIGNEFLLFGNLISIAEVKIYSDGFNYLGWSTSLSFGLR